MEEYIEEVVTLFEHFYSQKADYVMTCGGRFEVLGNHTDHNHGLCIASACDLQIVAAVKSNKSKVVNLKSKGFDMNEVNLEDLEIKIEETGSSNGLIRGVAAYLVNHGYKVGGFDAYTVSTVFKGAGVSSSAAFELLVGYIFNVLYNEGKIPTLVLCKAGQYAENEYFGKKSGLLDQIGVGYGGIVKIDFKDIENPVVEQVDYPFTDLHFLLINTGGDHSQLSDLYSSIPSDMYRAANEMKQRFLRDASKEELEEVKSSLDDMAYNRAVHFYTENERVSKAIEALKNKDEETFLRMINESRVSSTKYLKNMMVEDKYEGSPLQACDLLMEATENHGAVKINGGGFAGSVIAVIPDAYLKVAMSKMSKVYGKDNVKEIYVRPTGPVTMYDLRK